MKKIISRNEFRELLLTSLYSYERANAMLKGLGVQIITKINYDYYTSEGKFICNTENFCLDDILEKLNIEIED